MAYDVPPALRDVADRQRGVITRCQARSAGLSRDVIRTRLTGGRWQRPYPGIYAAFSGPPDRQATLWAAVLRAGPGAVLSYHTAAELDRLTDRLSSLIHITIPASRRVVPIRGGVLHVKLAAERSAHPSRLPPRTRIEETVLDLADSARDVWDAIGWVTAGIGRQLTTRDQLCDALNLRSRIRWRSDLRAALGPDLAGIHSMLEYRYYRCVEKPHGLPRPSRQSPVRRGGARQYRDVLYDEYAVAVELDGQVAHPGDMRWLDIRRDNAAAVQGVITLRYGYRELTVTPCLVAREVSDMLRFRGWRGPARRCSPDCPVGRQP